MYRTSAYGKELGILLGGFTTSLKNFSNFFVSFECGFYCFKSKFYSESPTSCYKKELKFFCCILFLFVSAQKSKLETLIFLLFFEKTCSGIWDTFLGKLLRLTWQVLNELIARRTWTFAKFWKTTLLLLIWMCL